MPPPTILLSDAARPFLNHMAENPDDIAARLVLCDWLQESGDPGASRDLPGRIACTP